MRDLTITVYDINELSQEAKEKAFNDWYGKGDYPWTDDNYAVLKKFCAFFPVEVNDYAYGAYGNDGIDWKFNYFPYVDTIKKLSGIRLLSYLWNNHGHRLYKGKYYSLWSKTTPNPNYREGGSAPEGKLKKRYSKVMFTNDCPLNGYFIDMDILQPIYDFMNKPVEATTFETLMDECLNAWITAYSKDVENYFSMDTFVEESQVNGWEYDENGNMI